MKKTVFASAFGLLFLTGFISFVNVRPSFAEHTVLALGVPAVGATLSGPLERKIMFVLPSSINPPHCWKDSAFWTGQELFYAISAISWTRLVGDPPAYTPDPECILPAGQIGPAFNIYSAVSQEGAWKATNLAINSAEHPLAGIKIDHDHMAYVAYEKTESNLGNIYLIDRVGPNSWSKAVPFAWNSSNCNDDNPDIYAEGAKIIFESNRDDAQGISCTASHQKLWSSTFEHGNWSMPVPLTGSPASGKQSFQPWLDEKVGDLYWTADANTCGEGAMNCVVRAKLGRAGGGWSSEFEKVIMPAPLVPGSTNGKVVLVGEYSQANGYAFLVCGIAREADPKGNTPTLLDGRWEITMNVCVIPVGQD